MKHMHMNWMWMRMRMHMHVDVAVDVAVDLDVDVLVEARARRTHEVAHNPRDSKPGDLERASDGHVRPVVGVCNPSNHADHEHDKD